MTFRTKLLLGGVVGLLGAVALAAGTWYLVIRSDAPPPVSLQAALEAAATQEEAAQSATTQAPATTGSDDLAGTWSVAAGDSFVGYRVGENLAGIGSTTAVGRTSSITGSLEFDGDTITSVNVTADLTTLTSDKSQRDGQLRTQALETNQYPTATFKLTSPIEIGDVQADGETVTQTVTGDLTLHGVTRSISLEVQGVMQNGKLVVVGSTEIQFADYNISAPRSAAVLSVDDHGTLELQLIFARS